MTNGLKCLAHPCEGVMEANSYDASLTCSACQFQVADESEYSTLVAGRRFAIDAALESLQEELNGWRHARPHDGVFRDVLGAIDRLRGTNPLADLQQKNLELARHNMELRDRVTEADNVVKEAQRMIQSSDAAFEKAQARIAELERELSEQADTIVDGLVKRRELERELAETRKDAERYEAKLFALGAMEEPPCFKCGYNGPGYFQTATHPCAHNHHNAMLAEREKE